MSTEVIVNTLFEMCMNIYIKVHIQVFVAKHSLLSMSYRKSVVYTLYIWLIIIHIKLKANTHLSQYFKLQQQ